MKLSDRVAIVTGAGQGIGEATAKLMAAEGAKVVASDINADSGQAVVDDLLVLEVHEAEDNRADHQEGQREDDGAAQ